ncbi:hypothetical protein [Kineococcus sp. SYSU DK001]|uniref:hypothetical protein n=1 Tax=Kineococcus sp. SYSU DK001 TaxID=3383122 RepID=UPI003D7E4970
MDSAGRVDLSGLAPRYRVLVVVAVLVALRVFRVVRDPAQSSVALTVLHLLAHGSGFLARSRRPPGGPGA